MSGCQRCDRSSRTTVAENNSAKASPEQLAVSGKIGQILASNSATCLTCALDRCKPKIELCNNIEGNADAGPATGKPKSQLCSETLACVIKSRCVNSMSSRLCYCGTAQGVDCVSGQANGTCKSKLEAGLETTSPQLIATQYVDAKTGGGAAMDLVKCLMYAKCDMCF
jgi:hypothetical protein